MAIAISFLKKVQKRQSKKRERPAMFVCRASFARLSISFEAASSKFLFSPPLACSLTGHFSTTDNFRAFDVSHLPIIVEFIYGS